MNSHFSHEKPPIKEEIGVGLQGITWKNRAPVFSLIGANAVTTTFAYERWYPV
jgi:hypothetical protein